jgi:hypothetical protein
LESQEEREASKQWREEGGRPIVIKPVYMMTVALSPPHYRCSEIDATESSPTSNGKLCGLWMILLVLVKIFRPLVFADEKDRSGRRDVLTLALTRINTNPKNPTTTPVAIAKERGD